MRFLLLQSFVTTIAALAVRQSSEQTQSSVTADLNNIISPASKAKIELRARWSTYKAPSPAVVVNAATEKDVAAVVSFLMTIQQSWPIAYHIQVQYCAQHHIPVLAQNAVTFTKDKKQATIGGGAIIGDVIPAANAAGALVITGNCNCVGAVGALLGGGYGMQTN
jgi:hypothetical protein